jgi:hypothetical protein
VRLVALLSLLSLSGCVYGAVYTHTTRPLATDFDQTPVIQRDSADGSLKQFRFRYADVRWDNNAIGLIAKQHGFETIYYADLELLQILGIWTQSFVHVYGEPADSQAKDKAQDSAPPGVSSGE